MLSKLLSGIEFRHINSALLTLILSVAVWDINRGLEMRERLVRLEAQVESVTKRTDAIVTLLAGRSLKPQKNSEE
jgi:hypothetical protein